MKQPKTVPEMIKSLADDEVAWFDLRNNDLIVLKLSLEVVRPLLEDDGNFTMIAWGERPGIEYFFHFLEHTYFPPLDEEMCQLYAYMILKWKESNWPIACIPIGCKEVAYEAAEQTGMRLADGIPFRAGPLLAAARPEHKMFQGIGELSKLVEWFPVRKGFTLENTKGSPVYEGKGGKQDAIIENTARVKKLMDEKGIRWDDYVNRFKPPQEERDERGRSKW